MNDARLEDPAMLPTLFWDFSTLGLNQPYIVLDKDDHKRFILKNKLTNGSRFFIADNYDVMMVTLKVYDPDIPAISMPRATLHWLTMKPVVVEVNSRDL